MNLYSLIPSSVPPLHIHSTLRHFTCSAVTQGGQVDQAGPPIISMLEITTFIIILVEWRILWGKPEWDIIIISSQAHYRQSTHTCTTQELRQQAEADNSWCCTHWTLIYKTPSAQQHGQQKLSHNRRLLKLMCWDTEVQVTVVLLHFYTPHLHYCWRFGWGAGSDGGCKSPFWVWTTGEEFILHWVPHM